MNHRGARGRREQRPGTLEPLRTISQSSSQSAREVGGWDTSCPVSETIRKEYNAVSDPYCPYTRTHTFKQHMSRQLKLDKLSKEQISKSLSLDLNTGIILNSTHERPTSAPENPLHLQKASPQTITISAEPSGNVAESETELEVLKAILSREAYLPRLAKVVNKMEKKFKPEIADLLDLIRISTVGAVEAILSWRKVKVRHTPPTPVRSHPPPSLLSPMDDPSCGMETTIC
jgi:hypothetical protein